MCIRDSIMSLSIQSSSNDNLYSYIENTVVPEMERISGVSSVDMRGGKREYVQVLLKEEEMEQYGLSMSDISSAISSADFNTTAGDINRGEVTLTLQGGVSYDTYESLQTIPLSLTPEILSTFPMWLTSPWRNRRAPRSAAITAGRISLFPFQKIRVPTRWRSATR